MSRGLLGILKLCLFMTLLPVIMAVIAAFHKELAIFKDARDVFGWGVAAYTVFHLFIFTPQGLYRFWQGIFMEICAFTGTVANIIVLAVPIVTTVLLLVYYISTVIFRQPWGMHWLIFLAGFTLAFHVVLSGQELYEADETQLKGHYLFTLGLIFIVNMLITAGLMDLIFKDFSFVAFWKEGVKITGYLYKDLLGAVGIRF
jgi:hypothetical protein